MSYLIVLLRRRPGVAAVLILLATVLPVSATDYSAAWLLDERGQPVAHQALTIVSGAERLRLHSGGDGSIRFPRGDVAPSAPVRILVPGYLPLTIPMQRIAGEWPRETLFLKPARGRIHGQILGLEAGEPAELFLLGDAPEQRYGPYSLTANGPSTPFELPVDDSRLYTAVELVRSGRETRRLRPRDGIHLIEGDNSHHQLTFDAEAEAPEIISVESGVSLLVPPEVRIMVNLASHGRPGQVELRYGVEEDDLDTQALPQSYEASEHPVSVEFRLPRRLDCGMTYHAEARAENELGESREPTRFEFDTGRCPRSDRSTFSCSARPTGNAPAHQSAVDPLMPLIALMALLGIAWRRNS